MAVLAMALAAVQEGMSRMSFEGIPRILFPAWWCAFWGRQRHGQGIDVRSDGWPSCTIASESWN